MSSRTRQIMSLLPPVPDESDTDIEVDSNESYVPDVDDIQHSLHSSSFEVPETELEEATPAASSSGDCRTADLVQGSSQETEIL